MRSLVRAVQCIKSSQKYRLLDRELPSKVSMKERKSVSGARGEEAFIHDCWLRSSLTLTKHDY